MFLINQIFWINLIMFIWFNTDALINYFNLFKINLFWIGEFNDYQKDNPKADYLNFLRIKHSSFFVNLITCKPCLCLWITLIVTLLFNNFYNFAIIYLLSYILYKILNKHVY